MRLPTYQQLDKEQDQVMNLPLDGSYLVTGPPGTGKTVVALYRANSLEEQAKVPMLLMYSRLLMMYTNAATDELDIEGRVKTFHSWFYSYYRRVYRNSPPELEKFVYDWMSILSVVNTRPPPRGNPAYLLVDEAQDLPPDFFTFASLVCDNLTIFADEHQILMDTNSTFEQIAENAEIEDDDVHLLTKNYRNTREIARLAADFYEGPEAGRPGLPDRQGDKPHLLIHNNVRETIDYIARYANTYPTKEIGVFLPTRRLQKRFHRELDQVVRGQVQIYIGGRGAGAPDMDFDSPGVMVVNNIAAKGLEFDTVFICEFQAMPIDADLPHFRKLMYVLVSRAREDLFITYSGGQSPAGLGHFDPDYLEGL